MTFSEKFPYPSRPHFKTTLQKGRYKHRMRRENLAD